MARRRVATYCRGTSSMLLLLLLASTAGTHVSSTMGSEREGVKGQVVRVC